MTGLYIVYVFGFWFLEKVGVCELRQDIACSEFWWFFELLILCEC